MSKLKLYQMFDTVSMTVFGPIIHGSRDEAVVRQFTDILNRPETLPGQYPKDFVLMHIGEQNQETGEIEPVDPQTIYTGRVWLRLKDAGADAPQADATSHRASDALGPAGDGSADTNNADPRTAGPGRLPPGAPQHPLSISNGGYGPDLKPVLNR